MSILAKKVGRLEAAREVVKQLEREIAIDLGLAKGRRTGGFEEARLKTDDELGMEERPKPKKPMRGPTRASLTPENVLAMAKRAQAMFAADPKIMVKDVVRALGTSDPSYYNKVLPVMRKLPMGAPPVTHQGKGDAPKAGEGAQAEMNDEEQQLRARVAQGGGKKEMAKDLGISKDTLYRRAKKYHLKI